MSQDVVLFGIADGRGNRANRTSTICPICPNKADAQRGEGEGKRGGATGRKNVPPAENDRRDGIGFDLSEVEAVRRSAFFQFTSPGCGRP